VAALVDTNVLFYRYDARFPEKQRAAFHLLRLGCELGTLCLPHQAIVEFVAATTRPIPAQNGRPLLTAAEARREAEDLLHQFVVLYPNEGVVRSALRGAATYQLSWFDAHLWAYADFYGLPELISEDFQHGRIYGTVRVVNPFLTAEEVHQTPASYGP
jgi:predicted nucleic acid-binding protein